MGLWIVYLIILIELIFVGYFDFKYKKISNRWSVFNLILFIAFVFTLPELYQFSWQAMFFPLVFFVITFFLYLARIMGAGDSKFLFTFYMIIPAQYQESVFLYQAYLTIAIGGSLLIFNTAKNFDKLKLAFIYHDLSLVKNVYGKKFAYAPVILGAWIWFGVYRAYEVFSLAK